MSIDDKLQMLEVVVQNLRSRKASWSLAHRGRKTQQLVRCSRQVVPRLSKVQKGAEEQGWNGFYTSRSAGFEGEPDAEPQDDHPEPELATASATGVGHAVDAVPCGIDELLAPSDPGTGDIPSSLAFRSARSARKRASSAFMSAWLRGGFCWDQYAVQAV